jgi:membrane protein YdbS with pleckstrin-like domain
MYNSFRQFCERILRIPPDPEPPPGDEESTRLFLASPNFYKYLLWVWAMKSFFYTLILVGPMVAPVVVAFMLVNKGRHAGWLLLFIPVFLLVFLVVSRLFALAVLRLEFEKRWYVITDRSLRIREGVIAMREMTITFANIQNISVSQGPIQRALGISDLRVDTAGGGSVDESKHPGQNLHTAWFRGIHNANEIRELIQERLRQYRGAGLGDREDHHHLPPSPSHVGVENPDFIAVLRELNAEARALRETVGKRAANG